MEKPKKNTKKIVISFITLIILAAVIFCVMIFNNSSYSAKSYEFSADVLNKVISAQKGGAIVEFNAEELNEALSPAFKKNKTVGNITVRGMNADIADSTLKFYVPITYKGFNFLMTTEGKVCLKNENIVYEPEYFRLGKIKIPKSYALKKLNGKFNGMLKTQDDTLNVDAKLVPMSMKSIEIKDSKLVISINPVGTSIKEKLEQFNNLAKNAGNGEISKIINKINENKSSNQVSRKEADKGSSNNSGNTGNTNTGDEQKVISDIMSAVSSNDKSAMSRIQAEYNNLSPEQKSKVQSAVGSSLDENTKNELMKEFH